MESKKKEEKKEQEKICAYCRNFEKSEDGTIYTKGAGYCKAHHDPLAFNKEGIVVTMKTQIFSHFHCSNNNFQPK